MHISSYIHKGIQHSRTKMGKGSKRNVLIVPVVSTIVLRRDGISAGRVIAIVYSSVHGL